MLSCDNWLLDWFYQHAARITVTVRKCGWKGQLYDGSVVGNTVRLIVSLREQRGKKKKKEMENMELLLQPFMEPVCAVFNFI